MVPLLLRIPYSIIASSVTLNQISTAALYITVLSSLGSGCTVLYNCWEPASDRLSSNPKTKIYIDSLPFWGSSVWCTDGCVGMSLCVHHQSKHLCVTLMSPNKGKSLTAVCNSSIFVDCTVDLEQYHSWKSDGRDSN